MKKTVRVIITKEFEIDINDTHLTEEALKEFSSYMFDADVDELFKYAARSCFNEDQTFVEGIGEAVPHYNKDKVEHEIAFECIHDDYEEEIIT